MTAIVIVLTTWIIGGSYLPDRPVYSSVSVAAVSYDTTAGAEVALLFSYGDNCVCSCLHVIIIYACLCL